MKIRLRAGLVVAGAVIVATGVFAGERLAFEALAMLMRATPAQFDDTMPEPPEILIECDEAGCETGSLYYEVLVDGSGRARAIRFDGGIMSLPDERPRFIRFRTPIPFRERPIDTRAARAVMGASWAAPASGRPFRAYQSVGVIPPERQPSRHVPFPNTEGQVVSITLERAGIPSSYLPYVVTLDSDGHVDFCGSSSGTYRSRISPDAFEALLRQFRAAEFFSLDDRYVDPYPDDGPVYFLRIRIGDQQKTVVDYYGRAIGMPRVVTTLQSAVDGAARTSPWIRPPARSAAVAGSTDCPTPFRATG